MSQRRAALRHLGRNSSEYKNLNRSVRAALRRDRRVELQREIGERGPNKVWQCIRSVVAGKKDGPDVQPDLSANDLNSFFVSVGPRVAAEIRAQNAPTDLNVVLPVLAHAVFNFEKSHLPSLSGRFSACVARVLAVPTVSAFAC